MSTTVEKTKGLQAGYRVTSGSPLNLRKFLRGDTYARGLNLNLDAIDSRLTSDKTSIAAQSAIVDAQGDSVVGRLTNLLVNGGFDNWQRGFSVLGGSIFTADMWKTGSGFGGTVARSLYLSETLAATSAFVGPFSAFISSGVATSVILYQRVSGLAALAGRTFQFSASVVTDNASRWQLGVKDSTGTSYTTSSYATGTGVEERLSVSITLATSATWIEVALLGSISDTAIHSVVFGDAALYVGAPATPTFVPSPPSADLYKCIRHYFRPGSVVYLPAADMGYQPRIARPLQLPMQQSSTPVVSTGALTIGPDTVASDIKTASNKHVVLGTLGGSVTADPDEPLLVNSLVVSADPF